MSDPVKQIQDACKEAIKFQELLGDTSVTSDPILLAAYRWIVTVNDQYTVA